MTHEVLVQTVTLIRVKFLKSYNPLNDHFCYKYLFLISISAEFIHRLKLLCVQCRYSRILIFCNRDLLQMYLANYTFDETLTTGSFSACQYSKH